MHIVFCGDKNIVKPVGVASASIVRNCLGCKIHISIVGIGWSNEDIYTVKLYAKGASIDYISADNLQLPPIRKGRHLTSAAYITLYLPQLFKKEKKILYLDYDILVRDNRIMNLWNTDMEEFPIAAVQSVGVSFVGSRNGIPNWREMNLDPKAPLFNSGVILYNPQRCMEIDLTRKALEYANKEGHNTRWADQQALNVAINGNWKSLPPIYNAAMKSLTDNSGAYALWDIKETDEARTNPCIVHFLSRQKPWKYGEIKPFFDEWRSISSDLGWTPWKDTSGIRKQQFKATKKYIRNTVKGIHKAFRS